jgi:SAM-dependent methyltransferase
MSNSNAAPDLQLSERATTDPTEIYADGRYLENNDDWHARESPWKAEQIKRILDKNHVAPATVCEVGCGAGQILIELSRVMPETTFTGYELSPQAFALSSPKANERVSYRFANILDEEVKYETLLCIDVFEHVEDYYGFLRGLRKKADYAVFHIPLEVNASTTLRGRYDFARDSVGHIHYFTAETAIATLKACGYGIIDRRYTPLFTAMNGHRIGEAMARLPRRVLWQISPKLLERTLGGVSMIVLAKT